MHAWTRWAFAVLVLGVISALTGTAMTVADDDPPPPRPAVADPVPVRPVATPAAPAALAQDRSFGALATGQVRRRPLADRRRTRRLFADLSSADARLYARQQYGQSFTGEPFVALRGHGKVLKIRDRRTAVVEGDKRNVLVQSTTALGVPDGDGGFRRMDLTPERDGSGFAPVAGPGALDLPGDLASGVEVGGKLRVETDADATGAVVGASVVYANSRTDTDTAVQPTPSGIELWDVLRSADSPENLTYRVAHATSDVPATLRRAAGGGTEILQGDNVVGTLSKVLAVDADGVSVPVQETLDGDELRLRVSHRDGDFAYPIRVDPVLEWYAWEYGTQTYAGWTTGSTGDGTRWPAMYMGPSAYLGNGLTMNRPWDSPGAYYNHGDQAWFQWAPPGGTYITTAGLVFMDMDLSGQSGLSGSASVCMVGGLNDVSTGAWQGTQYQACGVDVSAAKAYWSVGAQPRNRLYFGVQMSGGAWRQQYALNAGHAEMGVVDPTPPTVEKLSPSSTAWTTSTQLSVRGYDLNPGNYAGLGIDMLEVDGAARSYGCTGTKSGSPCPYYRDDTFGLTQEGNYNITLRSRDPAGTWSAPTPAPVKLDRSRPTLTSGTPATGTQISTESPTITVTAQDGVYGGTAPQARSGVKYVRVYLHKPGDAAGSVGTDVTSSATVRSETCRNGQTAVADSCPLTVDYTFPNGPQMPRGDYKLRVLAFDQLYQGPTTTEAAAAGSAPGEMEIAFKKIDALPPTTPTLVHGNGGYPLGWVDAYNGTVTATSTDLGSGIREYAFVKPHASGPVTDKDPSLVGTPAVPCDGTATRSCPATRVSKQFAYDTSLFSEGVTNPYVYATDGDGQQSANAKFAPDVPAGGGLKVDHSAPVVTVTKADGTAFPTGTVVRLAEDSWLQIDATDGSTASDAEQRSGVDSVELQLARNIPYGQTAPAFTKLEDTEITRVRGTTVNPCTGDSCAQHREFRLSTSQLTNGLHALRVIAKDRLAGQQNVPAAAHTTDRIVLFYVDTAAPQLTATTPTHPGVDLSRWYGDAQLAVSVPARDTGTGVVAYEVQFPQGVASPQPTKQPRSGSQSDPCGLVTTDLSIRCPTDAPQPVGSAAATYSTRTLPEGSNQLNVRVRDGVGRSSPVSQPWTVKVDHTAPTVTTSGSLRDKNGQTISEGGDYQLTGSAQDARSGVQRLELVIDGAVIDQSVPCQSADCPTSSDHTFAVAVDGLTEGQHTAFVRAIDAAGIPADGETTTFTVSDGPSDTTGYSYAIDDPLVAGDTGAADGDFDAPPYTQFCTPDADAEEDCTEPDPDNGEASEQALSAPAAGGSPSARTVTASGWGMAFQSHTDFDRPELAELDPRRVRIVVPWDTAVRPFKATACGGQGDVNANYANVKEWVRKAQAQNREVLVSFGRCAQGSEYGNRPSLAQYKEAISRFVNNRNFQGIRFYSSWNEPNSDGQPTSRAKSPASDPWQGARWAAKAWSWFAGYCRKDAHPCTVAAGEFVDGDDFQPTFLKEYKAALTRQPTVWAFHPYVAGQTDNLTRLERFLDATRRTDGPSPKIWFTEQGGIVNSVSFPSQTEEQATAAARRLVTKVATRSDRVTRFYYYALRGDAPPNFDSGLLRYTDLTKRPFFDEYKALANPS